MFPIYVKFYEILSEKNETRLHCFQKNRPDCRNGFYYLEFTQTNLGKTNPI